MKVAYDAVSNMIFNQQLTRTLCDGATNFVMQYINSPGKMAMEHALYMANDKTTAIVSKKISTSVVSDLESNAQNLNTISVASAGFWFRNPKDVYEQLTAANLLHTAGGLAIYTAEDYGKALTFSLLSYLAPKAIAFAIPSGFAAEMLISYGGPLACSIAIDAVKRVTLGGTLAEYWGNKSNPFGVEGLTKAELEKYNENVKFIQDAPKLISEHYEEMVSSLAKFEEILNDLEDSKTDKERVEFKKECDKVHKDYNLALQSYEKTCKSFENNYKSLKYLERKAKKAGFLPKEVNDVTAKYIKEKKADISVLQENNITMRSKKKEVNDKVILRTSKKSLMLSEKGKSSSDSDTDSLKSYGLTDSDSSSSTKKKRK